MALPLKFFEPSFRHRRLGTFLAVIVAVMVYIAAFVTAAEASLSTITLVWDKDVSRRMTVEIPAIGDEAAMSQADRVKQATAILRAMPGITHINVLPDDQAAKLLQPWISDADLLKALPVPTLIDIDREPQSTLTADDVRQQIKVSLRDVRVDDHAAWLADLAHFVHGIAGFGFLMIALAGVTLVLAVSLVCRTIMATESDTIALLHVMGADDDDIARHFERHAQRLSVVAAFVGLGLALISAGILMYFMRHFASPALLGHVHWLLLAVAVLAVPFCAIWISGKSARYSVLNCLRSLS